MGSRMLGHNIMQSSRQILVIYLQQQNAIHRVPAVTMQGYLNARHTTVFNEFSKHVKEEVKRDSVVIEASEDLPSRTR